MTTTQKVSMFLFFLLMNCSSIAMIKGFREQLDATTSQIILSDQGVNFGAGLGGLAGAATATVVLGMGPFTLPVGACSMAGSYLCLKKLTRPEHLKRNRESVKEIEAHKIFKKQGELETIGVIEDKKKKKQAMKEFVNRQYGSKNYRSVKMKDELDSLERKLKIELGRLKVAMPSLYEAYKNKNSESQPVESEQGKKIFFELLNKLKQCKKFVGDIRAILLGTGQDGKDMKIRATVELTQLQQDKTTWMSQISRMLMQPLMYILQFFMEKPSKSNTAT